MVSDGSLALGHPRAAVTRGFRGRGLRLLQTVSHGLILALIEPEGFGEQVPSLVLFVAIGAGRRLFERSMEDLVGADVNVMRFLRHPT
jgi:hypothetical protein